ncbi:MAG: hypothetical protein ABIQ09_19900 [Jatrophihabitantaceae bacterium]
MFEEVPRERRGLARLLPVQRVVLGPFVLGGGMLVAVLGGSVAVAAAATVLTASAIGSSDLPARPGPVMAPSTSSETPVSARQSPARHLPARPATSQQSAPPPATAAYLGAAGDSGATGAPEATSAARPSSSAATGPAVGNTAAPSTPSPASTPPVTGPRGNAVIHVNGYDHASGRLAYQFATRKPHGGAAGRDLYLISGKQTFTAALDPAATVISGGSICPPAGNACTPDQVISAADYGFFAEVAIDAAGVLRSIIEVGDQSADTKVTPVPSATAQPDGSRRERPDSSSPTAGASPAAHS